MSITRDVEQARRKQLWLSVVVTTLIAALAAAVTWMMALRDDPLWVQIALFLVFWVWVVWAAWEFRKIYVRMGVDSETPHIDT